MLKPIHCRLHIYNNNNVHLSCVHRRPQRSHDTYISYTQYRIHVWSTVLPKQFTWSIISPKKQTKTRTINGVNSNSFDVNPFTAPACKISKLKSAHTHARKQYIWRSYHQKSSQYFEFSYTSFHVIMWSGKKDLHDFKFGTYVGPFFEWRRGKHVAVKGLIPPRLLYPCRFGDSVRFC